MKIFSGDIKGCRLDEVYSELVRNAVLDGRHYQYMFGGHTISTKMSIDTCHMVVYGMSYCDFLRFGNTEPPSDTSLDCVMI